MTTMQELVGRKTALVTVQDEGRFGEELMLENESNKTPYGQPRRLKALGIPGLRARVRR